MKIKLFTHTDLDGVMCNVILRFLCYNDVEVTYVGYNDIDEQIESWMNETDFRSNDLLLITDICPHEETAAKIEEFRTARGIGVLCIDHHSTPYVLSVCEKYEWATTTPVYNSGIKACGASLLFEILDAPVVPTWFDIRTDRNGRANSLVPLVLYTRLWDTFAWEELPKDDPNAGMAIKMSFLQSNCQSLDEFYNKLMCYANSIYIKGISPENMFTTEDQAFIDRQYEKLQNKIKYYKTRFIKHKIRGCNVAIIFDDELALMSLACNFALKELDEIDFFMVINCKYLKLEFRTVKDGINLGKDIAPLFGGGGHPKAAGAELNDTILTGMVHTMLAGYCYM